MPDQIWPGLVQLAVHLGRLGAASHTPGSLLVELARQQLDLAEKWASRRKIEEEKERKKKRRKRKEKKRKVEKRERKKYLGGRFQVLKLEFIAFSIFHKEISFLSVLS